ncbi:MAG: hypothetical protein IPH20_18260 [Bacteroidales bacterium]|nr:hypothetical protein [Bacteroidales bacterium]
MLTIKLNRLFTLLIPGFLLFLSSCGGKEPAPYYATPYTLEIPTYFPTNLNIPADNPLTEEGIVLGRYLFYDGRLSGRTDFDSLMTCGSCHIQANSFEPGINNTVFHRRAHLWFERNPHTTCHSAVDQPGLESKRVPVERIHPE